MASRVSHRKTELVTADMVYRSLRAGPLTTKQVCKRLGLSDNGAENMLRKLPGIHHGKLGNVNLWSLD